MSTSENLPDPHRQQRLYWNEMVNLKADASYIRLYRDSQGRWVTWLGALKAIASSAGIAAWVVWQEYAFVWGAIIAASQLADALKDVFPFAKKHKAASALSMTLDNLLDQRPIGVGKYFLRPVLGRRDYESAASAQETATRCLAAQFP